MYSLATWAPVASSLAGFQYDLGEKLKTGEKHVVAARARHARPTRTAPETAALLAETSDSPAPPPPPPPPIFSWFGLEWAGALRQAARAAATPRGAKAQARKPPMRSWGPIQ